LTIGIFLQSLIFVNIMQELIHPCVLVTGAAGFIGRHVCRHYLSLGWKVVGLDNFFTGSAAGLVEFEALPNWHFVQCDIRDDLTGLFQGHCIDYVVHLAAIGKVRYSFDHPEETYDVNVNGTRNLMQYIGMHPVQKFIFASSSSVYGTQVNSPNRETFVPNPESPYAAQKLEAEHLLMAYSQSIATPVILFRFFNVFGQGTNPEGPYLSLITHSLKQMAAGKAIQIHGDGGQERDFTHVSNIVLGIDLGIKTSNRGAYGRPINLGTGRGTSVLHLVEMIAEMGQAQLVLNYVAPILEPRRSIADVGLANELLDYAPKVSLEDGLAETLCHYGFQLLPK
jgi:nucleoside-diphosphate-sugar epimerase